MNEEIHATAIVHRDARLGQGVSIGPYAVIEEGAELGDSTVVGAHAVVRSGSVLGARCFVDSHAVVGGLPQDLRFDSRIRSGVRVGAGVVLREGVTIHRATVEGAFTEVGEAAFLMANAHVAHDCVVGAHAVLANNVMLGGFVRVGEYVFLGGGAALHQGIRVGESAMVSGLARCALDIAPFTMMAERNDLIGLNLVGLKRRGLGTDAIRALKQAFAQLFREPGNLAKRSEALLRSPLAEVPEAVRFLSFFGEKSRGFARPLRHPGEKSSKSTRNS